MWSVRAGRLFSTGFVRPSRFALYSLAAALLAGLDNVLYLRALSSQPNYPRPWRPAFIAATIGVLALTALWASWEKRPRLRGALLSGAATGMIVLGTPSITSVGIPLIVAGLLSVVALMDAMRASPQRGNVALPALLGAATAVVVVTGGMNLIGLTPLSCPPGNHVQSTITDGGRTITYTCENGRVVP